MSLCNRIRDLFAAVYICLRTFLHCSFDNGILIFGIADIFFDFTFFYRCLNVGTDFWRVIMKQNSMLWPFLEFNFTEKKAYLIPCMSYTPFIMNNMKALAFY